MRLQLMLTGGLLFQVTYVVAQICSNVTNVTSFPSEFEFCVEQDSDLYYNLSGQLHPDSGCWNCMAEPRWFRFEVAEPGFLQMELFSDLIQPQSGDQAVVYYAVFDNCPDNGGTVLSYPCNCNNPSGDCWSDFGYAQDFITYSCFADGPSSVEWDCYYSEPWWNFPTTEYLIEFNVFPGEFWIAVWPSSNCYSDLNSFGCIEVAFNGYGFLGLSVEENERRVVATTQGIYILHSSGTYDLIGRKID